MTMTTFHLHVGVTPRNLHAVMRLALATDPDVEVYVDGDGWTVWGEPVGTDNNDSITLHVIFGSDNKVRLLDVQNVLTGTALLAPMTTSPTTNALTMGDDWGRGGMSNLTDTLAALAEDAPRYSAAGFDEGYGAGLDDAVTKVRAAIAADAAQHVNHYASADGPTDASTWTVYRERYVTRDDDWPIDGTTERVCTVGDEGTALALADALQVEEDKR